MAMDVTVEGSESFTTGSTPVDVKMDGSKPQSAAPPSPAPAADPEAAKQAFRDKMFPQPASGGDAGKGGNSAAPWPGTPEDAQRMIDRLMASPTFRADYANSNNPERAKLVDGMSELFKLANPEPGEERGAQTVQDVIDNLPNLEKFAGIHQPDFGPNAGPVLDQGDWAVYVQHVIEANISRETAQALADDYATRLAASGGRGLTPDDFTDLRAKYTGRLSPPMMDTLEKWITTEVYPRMRAQQGGR